MADFDYSGLLNDLMQKNIGMQKERQAFQHQEKLNPLKIQQEQATLENNQLVNKTNQLKFETAEQEQSYGNFANDTFVLSSVADQVLKTPMMERKQLIEKLIPQIQPQLRGDIGDLDEIDDEDLTDEFWQDILATRQRIQQVDPNYRPSATETGTWKKTDTPGELYNDLTGDYKFSDESQSRAQQIAQAEAQAKALADANKPLTASDKLAREKFEYEKRAKELEQKGLSGQKFDLKDMKSLNNDFNKLISPSVKIKNSYDVLEKLAESNSPTDQIAGLVSFMKAIDPGSTVTQTEGELVTNSQGPAGQIAGMWNNLQSKGKITQEAMRQLAATARTLAETQIQTSNAEATKWLALPGKYMSPEDRQIFINQLPIFSQGKKQIEVPVAGTESISGGNENTVSVEEFQNWSRANQ